MTATQTPASSPLGFRRVRSDCMVLYHGLFYRVCDRLAQKIIRVHEAGATLRAEYNYRFYRMTWAEEVNP